MSYPCGCSGNGFPSYASLNSGTCATTVSSELYNTLTTSAVVKLLGVVPGSTTQSFLSGSPGFVMADPATPGAFRVVSSPALQLPIQNAPTNGNFPVPSGFQYLFTASGGSPQTWQFLAAPSSGRYILQSYNGQWQTVDAGTIPGINQVAQSTSVWPKGDILSVNLVNGVGEVRKLQAVDKRVPVGDITDGVPGYKPLPDTQNLEHPLLKVTGTSRLYKLQGLDVNGADIVGGLPLLAVTGVNAVTDGALIMFSPTTQQLMLAPAHTTYQKAVSTNTAAIAVPASYDQLPSQHGAGASRPYSYRTVRIDFTANLGSGGESAKLSFAIFRDGQQIFAQESENSRAIVLPFIDENVPYGSHTYDIRWLRTSGSNVAILSSNLIVRTLA